MNDQEQSHKILKDFIVSVIADIAEQPVSMISTEMDLSEYGVDSIMGATLADEIYRQFGYEVEDLSDFIALSTIDDIAHYFVALNVEKTV
jgi:acyl carrier protein